MFDRIAGRDPLQKFQRSFEHFDMSSDFMQDLYNYVIMGFDPGSFSLQYLPMTLLVLATSLIQVTLGQTSVKLASG